MMGMLAGLLASFCASAAGYVIATQIFELDYKFNFILWLIGILGGMAGIGAAGIFGTRKVLARPPLSIIKNI